MGKGFERLLFGRKRVTRQPSLGAVAIFRAENNLIGHAAYVLERSASSGVYLLQKTNGHDPYYVSPARFAVLRFGKVTYYE